VVNSVTNHGSIIRSVGLPAATFVLGIAVQRVFSGWPKNTTAFLIASVLIVLVVLTFVLLRTTTVVNHSATSSAEAIDALCDRVDQLAQAAGFHGRYVEDGESGDSYRELTRLVRQAQQGLLFIDLWSPYGGYQAEGERSEVREDFYAAVREQIEHHKHDGEPFHHRIVQVSPEFGTTRVPFEVDLEFRDYLLFAAEAQHASPASCRVKIAVRSIMLTLIVIDRRHIILPVLSRDETLKKQTRHGAIFLDDRDGSLVKSLAAIYANIDATARPLTLPDLAIPENSHVTA
jgi:hypothetical protein